VIVVDDGSTDATVAIAEGREGVTTLRQRSQGPGAARNLGAAWAGGEVFAFTDADCVPAPSWLREGVAATAGAELVQGAVRPDPAVPRMPFDRTVWVAREGGLYECASLFVDRELFERIGGFEDWLGATMGKQLAEDAWLGWRARRAGARTAFSDAAIVHHAVFRRGVRGYALERMRLVYFPAIVRKMPELRGELLYGRWFLSRRTASFDAALVGAIGSLASSSPLPLALVVPYAVSIGRAAVPWRRHAPRAAIGELLADAVGFGALVAGGVRSRTAVL